MGEREVIEGVLSCNYEEEEPVGTKKGRFRGTREECCHIFLSDQPLLRCVLVALHGQLLALNVDSS